MVFGKLLLLAGPILLGPHSQGIYIVLVRGCDRENVSNDLELIINNKNPGFEKCYSAESFIGSNGLSS